MVLGLATVGCQNKAASPTQAGGGMQGMPVQTTVVTLAPVPQSSEYVATIKSRRSATLQPQVDGRLTEIDVKSGDHVAAGQKMMAIDPAHQQASVDAQLATERQKKRRCTTTTRCRMNGRKSCLKMELSAATESSRHSRRTTIPRQTTSRR